MKNQNRYILINHNCDISVLDTEEEDNLELFGITAEDQEGAMLMANQIDTMVCQLNEQDREIKRLEGIINSL